MFSDEELNSSLVQSLQTRLWNKDLPVSSPSVLQLLFVYSCNFFTVSSQVRTKPQQVLDARTQIAHIPLKEKDWLGCSPHTPATQHASRGSLCQLIRPASLTVSSAWSHCLSSPLRSHFLISPRDLPPAPPLQLLSSSHFLNFTALYFHFWAERAARRPLPPINVQLIQERPFSFLPPTLRRCLNSLAALPSHQECNTKEGNVSDNASDKTCVYINVTFPQFAAPSRSGEGERI